MCGESLLEAASLHPQAQQPPVVQSLSEYKESQKATWIPEKFPPAVSKKTCYWWTEITNRNSTETPLGCWKYTIYALHKGRNCTYAWGTGIRRIFASFFEQKRGGHDILWAGSCIFFLSDFSCKYIITVNAFNTYTTSKPAQNCSYCMCWSIITNFMQRQVNCQRFTPRHFVFRQTPTV